jgi:hypothetical protein
MSEIGDERMLADSGIEKCKSNPTCYLEKPETGYNTRFTDIKGHKYAKQE